MRARYSVLVVVVCIAVLMLTLGLPTASARGTSDHSAANAWGHTIVVKPNGSDDTADLQAAFNTCTSHGWTCTIQLVKGTYYTAQIAVYGFQGSFVGAGQGQTIIQGLPNLPSPAAVYDTSTSPFWAGAPTGASGSNPWPELFTFVNGAFGISGMTVTDTYLNPTVGWNDLGYSFTALWASILITGEQANVAINHVTIVGGPGDYGGFDNSGGIFFGGEFLPAGWTNPTAYIPLAGSFSMTDSLFHYVLTAVTVLEVVDATATVCFNTATITYDPWEFWDLSYSTGLLCDNQAYNITIGAGVWVAQSFWEPSQPSTVYIIGNSFADANNGASGILVLDFGPLYYGVASTLSAVVSGNVIQTNTSCGCYLDNYAAIGFGELASFVASGNLILGGGVGVGGSGGPAFISGNTILGALEGVGLGCPGGVSCIIYPEVAATDVHVTGNVIVNSGQYGIAVQNGSSDNVVAHNFVTGSGVDDLYWDGTGTGNVWFGNMCKTSSPPGLC